MSMDPTLEQALHNLAQEIEQQLNHAVWAPEGVPLPRATTTAHEQLAEFDVENHLLTLIRRITSIPANNTLLSALNFENLLAHYQTTYLNIESISQNYTNRISTLIQQFCGTSFNMNNINKILIEILAKYDRARTDVVVYIYNELSKLQQEQMYFSILHSLTKIAPHIVENMKRWFIHQDSPYPTEVYKTTIMKQFTISMNSINQFFSIKRSGEKAQVNYYIQQLQQPIPPITSQMLNDSNETGAQFANNPNQFPVGAHESHVDSQQLQLQVAMQHLTDSLQRQLVQIQSGHLTSSQLAAQNKKEIIYRQLEQLRKMVAAQLVEVQKSKQVFKTYRKDLENQLHTQFMTLKQFRESRNDQNSPREQQIANYPLISLFRNNNASDNSLQFKF